LVPTRRCLPSCTSKSTPFDGLHERQTNVGLRFLRPYLAKTIRHSSHDFGHYGKDHITACRPDFAIWRGPRRELPFPQQKHWLKRTLWESFSIWQTRHASSTRHSCSMSSGGMITSLSCFSAGRLCRTVGLLVRWPLEFQRTNPKRQLQRRGLRQARTATPLMNDLTFGQFCKVLYRAGQSRRSRTTRSESLTSVLNEDTYKQARDWKDLERERAHHPLGPPPWHPGKVP